MVFDKLGNMMGLMKQAKQLRDEMKSARYEAEVNGVQTVVNGEMEVVELKIPAGLDLNEAESSIKDSVNRALKSSKDDMMKRLQKIGGGFPIPGMF